MTWLNQAAVPFGRGGHGSAATLLAEARRTLAGAGSEPAPDDRFELAWLGKQLATTRESGAGAPV